MYKNHWNIAVLGVACCQNYSQKHWEKDSTARSRLWGRVTIYWKFIAGVIDPQSLWILNTSEVNADGGSRLLLQHLFFFQEYIVWIKTCLVKLTKMITQTQIHLLWWGRVLKGRLSSRIRARELPLKGNFSFHVSGNRRIQCVASSCKW